MALGTERLPGNCRTAGSRAKTILSTTFGKVGAKCLGTYATFILNFLPDVVQHLGQHIANELAAFDVEFILLLGV